MLHIWSAHTHTHTQVLGSQASAPLGDVAPVFRGPTCLQLINIQPFTLRPAMNQLSDSVSLRVSCRRRFTSATGSEATAAVRKQLGTGQTVARAAVMPPGRESLTMEPSTPTNLCQAESQSATNQSPQRCTAVSPRYWHQWPDSGVVLGLIDCLPVSELVSTACDLKEALCVDGL